MDKKNLNRITWTFVVVTVLIIGLMLSSTLRRPAHITLPETDPEPGQEQEGPVDGGALTVVEISPSTVQAAIGTLVRPTEYRRMVSVEMMWSGGSGSFETLAAASGGWTRLDRVLADGQTRHTLTDGETTYIWYNGEKKVYTAAAGNISADNEQSIPTYEDILALSVEDITAADYRVLSGVNCIYTETAPDEDGYALRYWVSVDTGLLVSAEKLLDGEVVYRMTAITLDAAVPTVGDFTLPDGKILLGN